MTRPAIVLGSTSAEVPDELGRLAGRPDVDVVRRRSGGGLVWLHPDTSVWTDVFVPTGDPLFDRDIGRAFMWLGDLIVHAAEALGVEARRHEGPYEPGEHRGEICFAGVGSGEVMVGDRKLVGISQRRTRAGSRFQMVWYSTYELGAIAEVVGPDVAAEGAVAGVGVDEVAGPGAAHRLRTVMRATLAGG